MELKPGYKQTEVGVIPEDWESVAIEASIDLVTGFPFSSSGYARTGVRLLRGSNVKRGVTDWSDDSTEYWPAITPDIRKYALKIGDIVVAMDGSLVGRSFAVLAEEDVPALLLQRVARIRSETITQGFLKAWICSPFFTLHCDAVKTVTAIPHISPADIRSFTISVPPTKAEQEAIAEALSDADALIKSLEQLVAKKRLLKQGAMQELLTGKKRLPGFKSNTGYKQTEAGVIPADWNVEPLGSICEIVAGRDLVKVDYSPTDNHTYPFPIYSNALTDKGLYGYSKSYQYEADRITVTARGDIGHAIYRNARFCAIGRLLVLSSKRACDLRFVTEIINNAVNFALESTGVPQLTGPQISKYTVALPPTKDEQEAIATILSDMDAEIIALEAKLAKARQIKQGMMQELLTGRIRLV